MVRQAIAPVLFLAAALLLLTMLGAPAPAHPDTSRDLLIARECAFGAHCPYAGPVTSFGHFMQGALWSHLLEAWERLHLNVRALELAVAASIALAAAVAAAVARAVAVQATPVLFAVWLTTSVLSIQHPILWNPSLTPLALALFHLTFVHAVKRRSLPWFCAAAFTLALSVELHVAFVVLIPVFVATVFACAARPILAALWSLTIVVETLALDSPSAFGRNLALVRPRIAALSFVVVASVAVGLALRRRLRARTDVTRARYALLALSAFVLVVFGGLSLVSRHAVEARYLEPVVMPIAIGIAGVVDAMVGARVVADVVALIAGAWLLPRTPPELSMRDAEKIAPVLYTHGGFDHLFVHLRGPRAWSLLTAVAPFEPANVPTSDRLDLLVLPVRGSAPVDATWSVVELERQRAALVIAYAPTVVASPLRVCDGPRCLDMTVDPGNMSGWRSPGLLRRAYPGIGALRENFAGLRVEYRMRRTGTREIVAFRDSCLGYDVRVDADEVVFTTITASGSCAPTEWLPAFAEVIDPRLRPLLQAAGAH